MESVRGLRRGHPAPSLLDERTRCKLPAGKILAKPQISEAPVVAYSVANRGAPADAVVV
jgi:hypothetical protein